MKDRPDLLIACGNKLRHKYFAIKLLQAFPNSCVLVEAHTKNMAEMNVKTDITEDIQRHFDEFTETESCFFGKFVAENNSLFEERLIRQVPIGGINDPETVQFIKEMDPKIIAVHSTSLIKELLIEAFPHKIINLHAGLSPYYRGSGTNMWPFYNKELEYVGMTVHYLDTGIDSGDVILQGRPIWEAEDNSHTIGCKNVFLGTHLMEQVIRKYLSDGPPPGHKQDKSKGKLYLKKYFNDDITRAVRKNIGEGLVRDYVENQKKVNIIEW